MANTGSPDADMDTSPGNRAVSEREKHTATPARLFSQQVYELMHARPAENAGFVVGSIFASVGGLRLVAAMHGENMRTHMRFNDYYKVDATAGAGAPVKAMIEDVVSGLTTVDVMLNVWATRPRPDTWSFSLSVLPKYAPLTLLVSKLDVRVQQSLVTLMKHRAFDSRSDRGSAWVKYTHFRYNSIVLAGYSPGVVLTAVFLNTVAADAATRARQLPLFSAALMAHADDVAFRPRHVPVAIKALCERNVRHMREAAHVFSGKPSEWDFAGAEEALAAMAAECERDISAEVQTVLGGAR